MNGMQVNTSTQATAATDEIGLMDLVLTLVRGRKLLVGLPLVAGVIAIGLSLLLPSQYTASVKLLPPQQAQSGAAALISQLGSFGGAAASAAGIKSPDDLYIGMLRSRTIADKLISKFALKSVYATDSMEEARRKLSEATLVSAEKGGVISVQFENPDKKLVAPLANAYIGELSDLTRVLAITEAGQRRLFYQHQLEQARDNLTKAESALKQGLDSRGVVSVDAESQVQLATIGRLRAGITAKEVQLQSMRTFMTSNNQGYKQAEAELLSMRTQLAKLESGSGALGAAQDGALDGKSGGFESIKLLRDVKYYQRLYELLARQYEAARLDEAKNPSVIQVLDPALEPERKSGPKRVLIVLVAVVVSFLLGICILLGREWWRRSVTSPSGAACWAEIKSALGR